ncbi:uncharacterized protein LOC129171270 isoform X2 [Dunckerocampus dactyliophorus]|uniref:uncharacterized protein LOC129171270 isoform X2 n=1 Tax=Dunckerocampus dactyliophorus TaxID=161453 RepID=UPI002405505B|nr:uncharacterized protein LOC129171270 isoform X2 [Dunckerocampus dactyliophorus]
MFRYTHNLAEKSVLESIRTMALSVSLQSKLSSIMEAMATSALAQLCKAVDDDTVGLRLELSRLQTLNSALTEKVDELECELTAAKGDAPKLGKSHRTVAIQTAAYMDVESEAPVIEGVFGKDWCLNLWKDRFHGSQRRNTTTSQQVDDDMEMSMPLDYFSSSDSTELEKGAEFWSFESLSEAVERWQKSNLVELYKRSSRSVENATKRARKKSYSRDLVFAELDFACTHGSRGPALKRCPFTIKVRVTPDGRKLFVKDISSVDCHNHDVSQALMPESEQMDVIQVKVEDYLEDAADSFQQETLGQEAHNSTPWTIREVQTFLGILAEDEVQRDLVGAVRNRKVFQLVSQRMAAEGFHRTCGQCQMKCKKLRCEYRKIKEQNRQKAWRWFDLVDAIYGRRPAIERTAGHMRSATSLLEAMMESVVENLDSPRDNGEQLISVGSGEMLTSTSSSPCRTPDPEEPGPSTQCSPRLHIPSRKWKREDHGGAEALDEMSAAAQKMEELHQEHFHMYMEDARQARRQEAQLVKQKLEQSAAVNEAFFKVFHSEVKRGQAN